VFRPGRLEVHIEINLPDENGRFQILQIHTNMMKQSSFLSPDVNLLELGMSDIPPFLQAKADNFCCLIFLDVRIYQFCDIINHVKHLK